MHRSFSWNSSLATNGMPDTNSNHDCLRLARVLESVTTRVVGNAVVIVSMPLVKGTLEVALITEA